MPCLEKTNAEISGYTGNLNLGWSEEQHELLFNMQNLKIEKCQNENSSISVNQNKMDGAIAIARLWPVEIPVPTLDLDEEGKISLYSFDSLGYVIAGLELAGEESRFAYIFYDNERKVAGTGYLNSKSDTEIEEFFKKLMIERSG